MPSDIKYFDDVLSKPQQDYVVKKLFDGDWTFTGGSSDESAKALRFWFMELRDDQFFTEEFFAIVRKRTGMDFQMLEVYANGQTYGLPGSFHYDDEDENAYTFLYYANPHWDLEWDGCTIFETGEHILPVPNRAILFKSKLYHYGNEPTRHCKELRVTVAFKLKLVG